MRFTENSDIGRRYSCSLCCHSMATFGSYEKQISTGLESDHLFFGGGLGVVCGGMVEPMNVEGIVKKYLKENGFDGLYESGECACILDDLFPCGEGGLVRCLPGYIGPCHCGEDHGFHIGPGPKSLKVPSGHEPDRRMCRTKFLK